MLALLFPGQASQAVGMGRDLRQANATARQLFELADALTGRPITQLCTDGPLEHLTATDVAQPAVVTTSLAALAVLRDALGVAPDAVAGHSVGEFAAYVAADVLDPEAALRLVHVRAQAMASACRLVDGSMAAIIGLDEASVRQACMTASHEGSSVEVANVNAPGQLIVSGAREAIERLAEAARAAGARRVLPLNVGGPFHSIYMQPAAEPLARALDDVPLRPARVPVVLNASAEPTTDPRALQAELAQQVYSPVLWTRTLERLAALGCDHFLEVGPGTVLTGLTKRTLPGAATASFGTLDDLDAVRAFLGAPSPA